MLEYIVSDTTSEIRQSEIITNLIQHIYAPLTQEVLEVSHPYSIVLTQDCDLLSDYRDRAKNVLNGVLLYELEPVEKIRPKLPGGDIFRRIKRHSEERYHVLNPVPPELDRAGLGLEQLIIDFRRYYTMPSCELYRQCDIVDADGAKRRCRLGAPYREHLQSRAAYYFQRVALPDQA